MKLAGKLSVVALHRCLVWRTLGVAAVLAPLSGAALIACSEASGATQWSPPLATAIRAVSPGATTTINAATFGALGDNSTDDTCALQSALQACSPGQAVYVPQGLYHISHPLVIPTGCVVYGFGGGAGEGVGSTEPPQLQGTTLIWTTESDAGTCDGGTTVSGEPTAMIQMHDVAHSAFEGINLEMQGFTPGGLAAGTMIGILYDSDDKPGSSLNVIKNLTIAGMHQGIVVGLSSDDAVPSCSVAGAGAIPGCWQADTLTLENFNIYGNAKDPTGEGIHVNSGNALQNSELRIGNIQAVNIGIHTVATNGIYAVRNVNGGSPVGPLPTFIKNEANSLPPNLYEVESEGKWSYGIHDSSCHVKGAGVQNWIGVAFFNDFDKDAGPDAAPQYPSLLDGCGSIVAVGTAGGYYSVSGPSVLDISGAAGWLIDGGALTHLSAYELASSTLAENVRTETVGTATVETALGIGSGPAQNSENKISLYIGGAPQPAADSQIGVEVSSVFTGPNVYAYVFNPEVDASANVTNLYGSYVGNVHGGEVANYYGYYCSPMENADASYCLYSASSGPNYLQGSLEVVGPIEAAGGIHTGADAGTNTDLAGQLTLSQPSDAGPDRGTVTWPLKSYTAAPICVATDITEVAPVMVNPSATALTVTGTLGHVVNYICVGQERR